MPIKIFLAELWTTRSSVPLCGIGCLGRYISALLKMMTIICNSSAKQDIMKKTTWTFPRHRDYERALREVAAAWFASKGFAVSEQYGYILADRDDWDQKHHLAGSGSLHQSQKGRKRAAKTQLPLAPLDSPRLEQPGDALQFGRPADCPQ